MLPEGIGQTLRHIHIGNYTAAREVFLNILLYVPMGYLLPFICKPMRYSIIACTVVGFLQLRDGICPAALSPGLLSD